jgi:hypothetical protein
MRPEKMDRIREGARRDRQIIRRAACARQRKLPLLAGIVDEAFPSQGNNKKVPVLALGYGGERAAVCAVRPE